MHRHQSGGSRSRGGRRDGCTGGPGCEAGRTRDRSRTPTTSRSPSSRSCASWMRLSIYRSWAPGASRTVAPWPRHGGRKRARRHSERPSYAVPRRERARSIGGRSDSASLQREHGPLKQRHASDTGQRTGNSFSSPCDSVIKHATDVNKIAVSTAWVASCLSVPSIQWSLPVQVRRGRIILHCANGRQDLRRGRSISSGKSISIHGIPPIFSSPHLHCIEKIF